MLGRLGLNKKNESRKRGEVSFGSSGGSSGPMRVTSSGHTAPQPDDQLPDDLHNYRTGDVNKGHQKVVRTLTFITIASVCMNVLLTSTVATMTPLRRDVPWVVVVDSAGDVDVTQAVWRLGNSKELTVSEIHTTQFLRYYFQVTADYRQMGRVWQSGCVDNLVTGDNFADELCAYLPARMSEEDHEAYVNANLAEVMAMVNARQTREVSLLREPLLMDTYQEDGQNVYLWEYQLKLSDFDNRGKAGPQAISANSATNQSPATTEAPPYFSQKVVVRIWVTFNAQYRPDWAQRYQNPLNFRMLKIEVGKLADGEEQ